MKLRVTTNPGGDPVHWVRSASGNRRALTACTEMAVTEADRVRRISDDGLKLKCPKCADKFAQWARGAAEHEASKAELDFPDDDSVHNDQVRSGDSEEAYRFEGSPDEGRPTEAG